MPRPEQLDSGWTDQGARQQAAGIAGGGARLEDTGSRGTPTIQSAMEKLGNNRFASQERSEERAAQRPGSGAAFPVGRAVAPKEAPQGAAYQALIANLWARHEGASAARTLLFVPAAPHAEAARVASGFANALARGDRGCVLLIDVMPKPGRPGGAQDKDAMPLERLLHEGVTLQPPKGGRENLYLLSNEGSWDLSSSAFRSGVFHRFLHTVSGSFSFVVISAPHPAAQPESLLLCRHVNNVVLVVESERTRRESARWTARQIEASGGQLLGVVIMERKFRIPRWIYSRI